MNSIEIVQHLNWAEIILNRPERRNAITGPMGRSLNNAIDTLSADLNCQLILLRGAGGAFCSGLDLKEFQAQPEPEWMANFPLVWRGVHRALFECKKPVVVALERFAINAGAALALAADLLIVGEGGFLQIGEVQRGMAAPYNLAWLNLRYPEYISAQLALVGRRFSAGELKTFGIAHQVVPDQEVLTAARSFSSELAAYPPEALTRLKQGLRARVEEDADTWFDRFTTI